MSQNINKMRRRIRIQLSTTHEQPRHAHVPFWPSHQQEEGPDCEFHTLALSPRVKSCMSGQLRRCRIRCFTFQLSHVQSRVSSNTRSPCIPLQHTSNLFAPPVRVGPMGCCASVAAVEKERKEKRRRGKPINKRRRLGF